MTFKHFSIQNEKGLFLKYLKIIDKKYLQISISKCFKKKLKI